MREKSLPFIATALKAFGNVIVELRQKNGLSQRDLARTSRLKLSHLKRIEQGAQQTVSWAVTLRIAKTLGLKINQVTRLMEKNMKWKQKKFSRKK